MKQFYIFCLTIVSILLILPNVYAYNFYNHTQYGNKHNFIANNNVHCKYRNENNFVLAKADTKEMKSPYLDSNTSLETTSILDLKKIKDDEYVTVKGYIIKKIKHEKFLFKDETGEIELEIDKKLNKQLVNVNKTTLVEVYGELDKDMLEKQKIDVKKITILK